MCARMSSTQVALCQIHVAALITEYLHQRGLGPEGCQKFSLLSPNIVCDESNLRLDSGNIFKYRYLVGLLSEYIRRPIL